MSYWDIKVYDGNEEKETLRGVSWATKKTLMQIFDREGIKAVAMEVKDDRSGYIQRESVNLDNSSSEKEVAA